MTVTSCHSILEVLAKKARKEAAQPAVKEHKYLQVFNGVPTFLT